ncbi:hypothetical protein LY78DRAFT_338094 [Colletotrichum sublineola]|nr:hypothetical protein LY78DRAFT_338094 [Colletotrichum sublineola]
MFNSPSNLVKEFEKRPNGFAAGGYQDCMRGRVGCREKKKRSSARSHILPLLSAINIPIRSSDSHRKVSKRRKDSPSVLANANENGRPCRATGYLLSWAGLMRRSRRMSPTTSRIGKLMSNMVPTAKRPNDLVRQQDDCADKRGPRCRAVVFLGVIRETVQHMLLQAPSQRGDRMPFRLWSMHLLGLQTLDKEEREARTWHETVDGSASSPLWNTEQMLCL